MMKKRVFIAIDLPQEVKKKFESFFEKVSQIQEVKWEKLEKLHLTLVFLGRTEEEKIQTLTLLLDRIKVNYKSFTFYITPKLSAFPTISNPRVLWLPIKGEIEKLRAMTETLQKMLHDKNFQFDEREFHAHLTLGRFRSGVAKWQKEKALKIIERALPKDAIDFTVGGITLFESTLTPKGSRYTILYYADFRD